ncbi:hypothetical protein [Hymenobacter cellulosivorans]|uniref:Uncharacterized protein n=1 Tax=Hymenobacter cellulosivorans TaxID=2932249 RepID=A0ABY4F8N8_9BACT|nr:hypothetical protein [Hymenobacter cellulosivorans]UOQ53032.1 hypothetical protein MUN80_25260 [Hymenobacter cellulosivorans]
MPITHYAFRALPFPEQLAAIWAEGTFLATRWEEEDAVNLYHLGTFFCEVYYDPDTNELLRTRTFTSRTCLEDYAAYIKLDDLET